MKICISGLNESELSLYSDIKETSLLHYFEPEEGLFIAETPVVIERALNVGYVPRSFLLEERQYEILSQSKAFKPYFEDDAIPVYVAKEEVLEIITGYKLTKGVLCLMYRKKNQVLSDICEKARRIAVLENVMNPTNVGAIIRSAAALGLDAVVLTEGCADPLFRRASRVSVGTVFQIPWTFVPNDSYMDMLHRLSFKTVAMALRKDTINIDDVVLKKCDKLAILLGTEATGLREESINASDYTVKIPMFHGVDSLNVSVAAAISFWELSK